MWRNTKALIIFGFCLGLIIVPNFVSATWWNTSWSYKRPIEIQYTGDNSVITDYQVPINVTYDSDMKTDFSDIRFVNSTDDTEIDYWLESKSDSNWAKFWIEVPRISNTANTTIDMYYGNAGATSNSNGKNTFLTFDDFEDNSFNTSLWYTANSGDAWVTEENGYLRLNTSTNLDRAWVASLENHTVSIGLAIDWIANFTSPQNIQLWISSDNGYASNNYTRLILLNENSCSYDAYKDGTSTSSVSCTHFDNDQNITQIIYQNGSIAYYRNGTLESSNTTSDVQYTENKYHIAMGAWDRNSDFSDLKIYTVWVRRYTDPEPTYSIGSEESQTPTEITITDLKENPSDPATYSSGATYQFNATICDTEGTGNISSVKFEWSGSNTTITDYATINATCREYYTSKSDLSADTYNYKWYAEDSTNSLYDSETGSYTVNKATPSLSHSVTSPITYGTASDYTASESNSGDSDCSYILERNGTQIDTGSSVSDTTVLGAGTYNYTYYTTGGQNYTSNSVTDILTVNKASANFSLSSSPSWSVSEGTSVTITAEATPNGTITLYKDGNIVSNPYTASLPYGTYNFTATYDHANYTADPITKFLTVSSGGFGCTDNETYAFEKTISATGTLLNLNFTDLVADNLVRSDLKDVYINQSVVSNVWTNFTDGYYIVVNTTDISNFDVKFGNYIANNSYTNHTLSENTTDMTGYTQINPYYVLTFIEESDGTQQLPPDTNSTTVSLFCSGGVSSFDVEDDKLLVSSFNQLTDIKATVTYSATEIYYRNYMVSSEIEYKYVYLVDANQHQVVQLILTLQDETGDFSGSTLKVKKYLEGSLRTITEQQFDAENKVVVYLINGDKYQLYVDNGNEERNIGYLNVDPVDLDKTLVIFSATTTNMTVIENMSYDLTYDGSTIHFVWSDPAGQTDSVEFYVYNYTNDSQVLYYASSSNHSYVVFDYNVPVKNDTYIAKWLVHHNVFGLNTTGQQVVLEGSYTYPASFPLSDVVTYLGGNSVMWFVLILILPLPMIFSRRHAGIGALFLVGIVALFNYWHFIDVPIPVLATGLLIAIFIELINRRSAT